MRNRPNIHGSCSEQNVVYELWWRMPPKVITPNVCLQAAVSVCDNGTLHLCCESEEEALIVGASLQFLLKVHLHGWEMLFCEPVLKENFKGRVTWQVETAQEEEVRGGIRKQWATRV